MQIVRQVNLHSNLSNAIHIQQPILFTRPPYHATTM